MNEPILECSSPSDYNTEAFRAGVRKLRDNHAAVEWNRKLARMTLAERVKSLNEIDAKASRIVGSRINVTSNGVTKTLEKWCAEYGVAARSVETRVRRCGDTWEDALSHVIRRNAEMAKEGSNDETHD